jgi:ABC-2 type transport system permease protein
MTLFLRELKGNFKSFVIWTLCIIVMLGVFLAMFPSFAAQGESLDELLSGFSEDMLKIFSFDNLNFTVGIDYYAYIFQYILLAAMIQFMIMGAGLISREEDGGTINFLYAKPLSRSSIVTTKFLAGLTYAAVFFVVFTASACAVLAAVDAAPINFGVMLLFSCALSLGQLMMMGIGMLISMFVTKTRTLMSVSIGVVLLLYILSMVINLNEDLSTLKYVTPFQYFDSRSILHTESIEWVYVILPAGVALAGYALSLVIYNRRDLKC